MADSNDDKAKQSPTDRWADDVVEGAAASKSAVAPEGLVHEVDGDDDEILFSSAIPDKPMYEPEVVPKGTPDTEVEDTAPDAEIVSEENPEVEDGSEVGVGEDAEFVGDPVSVEGLISDLERVTEEKDQYLDTSRRLQADFDNYRKRVAKDTSDAKIRGKESVISGLLNVLDACDGAVANGAKDVEPIRSALLSTLTSQGLERLDPVDAPFDPEQHEAVMHDDGGDGEGPVVAEVMRPGYILSGRVVRPAMVRVRG